MSVKERQPQEQVKRAHEREGSGGDQRVIPQKGGPQTARKRREGMEGVAWEVGRPTDRRGQKWATVGGLLEPIYWTRSRSSSPKPKQTDSEDNNPKSVRFGWKPWELEDDAQEYRSRGCEFHRKGCLTHGEGDKGGPEIWGWIE